MEKTKTNKKNKSSIVVLLVAILLCVAIVLSLSGVTLAKYISSKEMKSQTAQVAKWGYVIGVDQENLFADAYAKESETASIQTKVDYSNGGVGVQATANTEGSAGAYNVVAPGTSGYVTFSITGSAEVRSAITIAAGSSYNETNKTWDTTTKTVTLTGGSISGSYEPIKWTLSTSSNGTDYTESSSKDMTYSEMITALNALDDSTTDDNGNVTNAGLTDIAPNTTQNLYYKLSWAWEFENNDDTTAASNNLYDTILSSIMAYKEGATGDDANVFWGPSGQKIKVTSATQATVYTDDSDTTGTTYTATTSVSLGLTVSVAQIQGTAATGNG